MSAPAPKTQDAPPRLLARLSTRHGPDQEQLLRRLARRDALASMWAPVLVFAAAFLPYIALIELVPDSVSWALPLLRGFGLLLLVWWVGLGIFRLVRPSLERARRFRRDARDLLRVLDARLAKLGTTLAAGTVTQIEEQGAKVQAAMLDPDLKVLEGALATLQQTASDRVPGMRQSAGADFFNGLLKALAVALVIRTIFIEPYRIPSGSMLPTLQIGDHVFINKFIYGVRIPFTNTVPFVIVREPARGDVVVFQNPVTGEDYIKRVVGVGGDTIELREGVVYVNGVAQERTLVDDRAFTMNRDDYGWQRQPVRAYEEHLGDAVFTSLQARGPGLRCPYEGPFKVPEGELFVVGDNRDASSDSRYGLSPQIPSCSPHQAQFVPLGHVKGKAMVVWIAWGHDGLLSGLFGGSGLRTDRLFIPVR